MVKFSVVIPLIPQHDRELGGIFFQLNGSREILEEIIICRSESLFSQNQSMARITRLAEKNGISPKFLKFSFVSGKATAGENRNRGWNLASGSHVAFLDADDSYAKNRLEVIRDTLEKSDAKAVVHKFGNHSQKVREGRKESLSFDYIQSNADGIFTVRKSQVSFHCAHLTLETSLRSDYQYSDIFPGEDLELVSRMINNGVRVFYIDHELSSWNRNRSFRYELRRLRKKILPTKFLR